MSIKMERETDNTVSVIEFNAYDVHKVYKSKNTGKVHETWNKLWKYSRTVSGYMNQLLLQGYKVVR